MAICVMVHGSTMSIKHAQKVLKLKTTGILLFATPFSGFYVTESIGDAVFMFKPSPDPLPWSMDDTHF